MHIRLVWYNCMPTFKTWLPLDNLYKDIREISLSIYYYVHLIAINYKWILNSRNGALILNIYTQKHMWVWSSLPQFIHTMECGFICPYLASHHLPVNLLSIPYYLGFHKWIFTDGIWWSSQKQRNNWSMLVCCFDPVYFLP